MPSTTREGMNLPSRPNFSLAIATPSKMSMPTENENELLDDSMDDEVTHDSSSPSFDKNSEPNRETAKANASKLIPLDCIAAFGRAFVEADLDNLDRFDSLIHASLGDLFPIISKTDEPIVCIKDPAYEFSVNPDIIELVEKNNFCGKDDEYLMHVKCIHNFCTLPLDIPPYLHHILVMLMLFDDYWE
jgi:hypothetical protein